MEIRLSEAEQMIMQILWEQGEMRATYVADIAREETGWEKNTSYTFLQRLIKKGAVTRRDPGFYCSAACKRSEIRSQEAKSLVDKFFDGSIGLFVQSFLDGKPISTKEKERLRQLIDEDELPRKQ